MSSLTNLAFSGSAESVARRQLRAACANCQLLLRARRTRGVAPGSAADHHRTGGYRTGDSGRHRQSATDRHRGQDSRVDAAVLGLIPIAGEVFWGPMAYAMIGGLLVATVLTLFFLPALYAMWYRVRADAIQAS